MSNFIVINEIEELLNDMNDGLTSTLSTISSNVNTIKTNVATILTNTNTNNTASTTGTLSQKISSAISNTAATTTENSSGTLSAKLTYLINRRDKVVTPSSTNLKTMTSSQTVTATSIYNSYGNTTTDTKKTSEVSCYVKYDGTYRIYLTANTTATRTGGTGCSACSTCSVSAEIKIYVDGEAKTTNITIGSAVGGKSISSTTKTTDVFLSKGSKVSVTFSVVSYAPFNNCNGEYWVGSNKLNVTDVSLRGTLQEINGTAT